MGRHAAERPARGGRRAARARRRPPVKTVLVAALLLGAGSTGTYAYWSDQVTVGGTTITSGTIDLTVDGLDAVTATTKLDMTAMVPGNSVAAVFAVQNAGTAPLEYHLDSAASNADGLGLGSEFAVRVTDGSVIGSQPTQACDGTVLATSTGFTIDLLPPASARTVPASGSDSICIEATLPSGTPVALAGATTNVTLTFTGTSF